MFHQNLERDPDVGTCSPLLNLYLTTLADICAQTFPESLLTDQVLLIYTHIEYI